MIKGCQNECTGGGCSGESGKQMTESFKASDLIITPATTFKEKPDPTGLVFGTVFTDNMLTIEWSLASGWEKPYIKPLENLSLHPASSALHYAIEPRGQTEENLVSLLWLNEYTLFEGMKAYRGVDGKIRLFRPALNMDRMARSARRTTLPSFDQNELLECIRKLVEVEQEWVPYSTSASLYIRPTLVGTEPSLGVKKPTKALLYVILSPVGPYFASGSFNPISLWADPKYVRAWKGGTGDCKVGGNYGSALYAQQEALEFGCQQVLWLYGEDHQITEVGTMNLFLYWINEDGENELATPPLDGIILPGVTRQSILDLARDWGEFKVSERYITMSDLTAALEKSRVKEMFGAGTACIVCPISKILYKGKHLHIPTMENGPELTTRFLNKLSDIQYGREDSDWAVLVS
ncbi:branched-chain-amino-acid aminotransferase, cytosolic isoform X2 [Vidua macroura]|uniref:branched-chain-amino-acid aminotransferase, cytosolic isoform X2 n=1 Tax=Vidua chalybeata TaxID=81927 RepID=UPI0023A8824D|nr:branched-chain-amino-acid aminotransferase, cytosolic isoform X2 [Vidua chalybeata]XP_053834061.1 branched-chain-amino-acid aminotransferase, cytosolic isoform X2 [Vidua macroura]